MPNMRSRTVSRITEAEINELVFKLQALLPHSNPRSNTGESASKILNETCHYIKKLHEKVDDLSDRLSQLAASGEITNTDADVITRLLQQ